MSNFEELTSIAQNVERLSDEGYKQSDFYQLILTLGKLSGILRTLNINSGHNALANDIVIMVNNKPTFEQLLYYIATLIEILGDYYIGNTKGDYLVSENGEDKDKDKSKVKFRRYRKKKNNVAANKSESPVPNELPVPVEPSVPNESPVSNEPVVPVAPVIPAVAVSPTVAAESPLLSEKKEDVNIVY